MHVIFFSFWNDMEIIWWNDNEKKMAICEMKTWTSCSANKLCICEEFNGAKFKSPIKPYYISCKKQAQFNEKKYLQEDQFWL